jgi:hypothetical protein
MTQEPPIITLLTDFGLRDEYVGVMKGVVLSINSRVQLVDITHNISRHAIMEAALVLKTAFRYFPKGSIHVIVVDPGVGGRRRIICVKKEGHFFVAPDNGVLSLVMAQGEAECICVITNEKYFMKPVSRTFHGRDIFAPVAAYLSKGVPMPSLGEETGTSDMVTLPIPTAYLSSAGELVGSILWIDHFGNLVTNIDQDALKRFRGERAWADLVICLGRSTIQGVSTSYNAVKKGAPICLIGSRNLLEISVNQQDARTYFKARVGQTIRVKEG